ncbi:MAG: hypothetical protein Kow00121_62200 [Elainellaceae cyanobacterium]
MGQSLNSVSTNGLIRTESERFFEQGRAAFEQEVRNLVNAPTRSDGTLLNVDDSAALDENDLRELEELEENFHHSSRFHQQRDRLN